MTPKYTIMIPSYNGIAYLPSCVSSVISQKYIDYELIISDDHSDDGTKIYLDTLNHPNITILYPQSKMSMSEHWEWILSHAKGEWCIFLGQDDGLLPYFFELADVLTNRAKKLGINAIASERAYYFWPGCESIYGNAHISYSSIPKTAVFNTKTSVFLTLCGYKSYFFLPQMYTTSIFNKCLINKARIRQNGAFLITHPQDANLAAISCSVERRYLYSYIPLGWVGSSPKSAGLALNTAINKQLSTDYVNKINKSKFEYCDRIGDFKIGSCTLYFWGALIKTGSLQSKLFQRLINSRFMTYIVISAGRNEIKNVLENIKDKYNYVENINGIKHSMLSIFMQLTKIINLFIIKINRIYIKIIVLFLGKIKINYSQKDKKQMVDINDEIEKIVHII